jgi:4-aminobutyrate aminotransferase-like enzyme
MWRTLEPDLWPTRRKRRDRGREAHIPCDARTGSAGLAAAAAPGHIAAGPASRSLHARRAGAVAGGVSSVLPVYVSEAAGGLLVDVDGNSLLTRGTYGNVIRLLPPLVIGDDLLTEGLDILDLAFATS